jgi:hypothetical protein
LRLPAAVTVAMTIRITQIDDETRKRTILRVEGKLLPADAEIVEQAFEEIRRQNNRRIEINLAAVSFINSDGAEVLRRIERRGAALTGLDFFTRQVIETHETKISDDKK